MSKCQIRGFHRERKNILFVFTREKLTKKGLFIFAMAPLNVFNEQFLSLNMRKMNIFFYINNKNLKYLTCNKNIY